jgi:hypothetical protein
MRILAIALAICVATTGAYAQTAATSPRTPSCHDDATTKKLAGAALTSFMKKCQTDSATACDTAASDKKLAGAAKTSSPRSALLTRSDNRATGGHYRICPSITRYQSPSTGTELSEVGPRRGGRGLLRQIISGC